MKCNQVLYHFVTAKNRINEDLTLNGIDNDLPNAVAAIRPDAKVEVEKDKYTVYTKKELTRWQKIQIGMEIAKIPYLRNLRTVKRNDEGKIISSTLFKRTKEKKAK